ncbi:transposase [Shewanella baltica]|nr:transposase [Shewanella baltica]MDR9768230.1 transposase [Shewanella baltica]
MLSRRFIIETINDQLKNISQIEHSIHRSVHGFMLNIGTHRLSIERQ